MINFFRKIRQKLLKEGKTSSYLKYALGEIGLVMVGILLALQVNNWNENRVKKDEIRDKLMRILEEINANKESTSENIYQIDSVHIRNNIKTLQYLKSKNKDSIKLLQNTLGSSW